MNQIYIIGIKQKMKQTNSNAHLGYIFGLYVKLISVTVFIVSVCLLLHYTKTNPSHKLETNAFADGGFCAGFNIQGFSWFRSWSKPHLL